MQKRLRSLQRILVAQKDLQRIAEWKLANLQRREVDLQKDQERLVSYLDEQHAFTPSYAKTIIGRLQALATLKQATIAEKQRQAERLLTETRRVGQMERRVDAAAEILRRVQARKDLEEIVEAEVMRKPASFR